MSLQNAPLPPGRVAEVPGKFANGVRPTRANFKGSTVAMGELIRSSDPSIRRYTDWTAMMISEDAYGSGGKNTGALLQIPKGYKDQTGEPALGAWRRIGDQRLAELGLPSRLFHDRPNNRIGWGGTGFTVGLYESDDGEYMLAFGGTDAVNNPKDVWTDIKGGLGFMPEQMNQAARAATAVRQILGDNFAITGHSLGGGLAAYAGIVSGAQTVSFNPMDLPHSLIKNAVHHASPESPFAGMTVDQAHAYARAPKSGHRQYVVHGEFLDNYLQLATLTKDFGAKTRLPTKYFTEWWQPGSSINNHLFGPLKKTLSRHLDRQDPPT